MIIKEVKFSEVYKDLYPMFQRHWDELGENGSSGNFALDFSILLKMEMLGTYISFAAMDDDKYIGYCGYAVTQGIHSASDKYAITDAVYIDKEYRDSLLGAGIKLLKHAETVLRDKYQVTVLQFGMNVNYDISGLLERMGYIKAQVNYNKYIGE